MTPLTTRTAPLLIQAAAPGGTGGGGAGDGGTGGLVSGQASVLLAVLVGVLVAAGVFLLLQRALTRVIIGLALLTHAGNLLLLVAGGRAGAPPFVGSDGVDPGRTVDPLPQAMALTAVVISFGVTALLLALAYRSYVLRRDDVVQDDIEDRRIARTGEVTRR